VPLHTRAQSEVQKKATFALNLFFDVSEEEFKSYRMKPFDVRDAALKKRSTLQKGTVVHDCLGGGAQKKRDVESWRSERAELKAIAALPTSFDWRNHKPAVVSPVKNQAQCGSCWAFSTMETLESAWAIAGKGLPILAPQELVDCSTDCSTDPGSSQPVCDQGCDGGFPWAAVQSLIELGGADSEASYPYQGVDGTCAFNKANVKAVPRNHTCISNAKQDGASATNADMLLNLYHGQPLSICMDASEWQFYDSGVFTGDGCSETQLDHAIQVTGWGEENGVFWGKTLFYNVRNSWSSVSAVASFFFVSRQVLTLFSFDSRGERTATFASSAARRARRRTRAAS
jgi:cathepsin F